MRPREEHAQVDGFRSPGLAGEDARRMPAARARAERCGLVGRAVVNDHDLVEVRGRRGVERGEALAGEVDAVEDGDHDRRGGGVARKAA